MQHSPPSSPNEGTLILSSDESALGSPAGEERFFVGRVDKPGFVFDKTAFRLTACTLAWLRDGRVDKDLYYEELKGRRKRPASPSTLTKAGGAALAPSERPSAEHNADTNQRGPIIDLTQEDDEEGDPPQTPALKAANAHPCMPPTSPDSASRALETPTAKRRCSSDESSLPRKLAKKAVWTKREDKALFTAQSHFGEGMTWAGVAHAVRCVGHDQEKTEAVSSTRDGQR